MEFARFASRKYRTLSVRDGYAQWAPTYEAIVLADVLYTGLRPGTYGLVIQALADEHLSDLRPLYKAQLRLGLAQGARLIPSLA